MPMKRASQKPNVDHVFGQARKRTKMLRAGLYARVSTNDQQTLAMQNRAMREYATRRELSAAVRKSEAVTLRSPVMPVADGLLGGFVRVDGFKLRKRNGHLPALPTDLHKHVVFARVLNGHA